MTTSVLRPGLPVLIDAGPLSGSLLWRRGDRGVILREAAIGGYWLIQVNGQELWFDADELIDASERRR